MTHYNKSEIMRKAHYLRSHSFVNISMSDALKQVWKKEKNNAKEREESEKRLASVKRTVADEYNARLYRNVRFGRDDWAVDYGCRYRYKKHSY